MIIMGRPVEKMSAKKDAPMQWHMQAGNITINIKVKVDFTLPALSMKNFVTRKCHVNDSAKGKYNLILRQDLLI